MMNPLATTALLLFVVATTHGQGINRQDADSMLVALKKSKQDIHRIDLLLHLAQFHIFKPGEQQMDFDSAMVYINEASALNNSVKSSAANGYLLLTESFMTREKGKRDEAKKMTEKAVSVLETGKNKSYLGEPITNCPNIMTGR